MKTINGDHSSYIKGTALSNEGNGHGPSPEKEGRLAFD